MKLAFPKVYAAATIAQEMLNRATQNRRTLTPMQLIKLVYLAHGWMLAFYKRPLIKDPIEAWQYGPVIPKLYHAIKQYRSNPVEFIECEQEEIEDDAQDIIEQVYDKYGHLNGIRLSMLTHEKNSPWEKTWNNHKTVISNDLIAYYYEQLARSVNEETNPTLS